MYKLRTAGSFVSVDTRYYHIDVLIQISPLRSVYRIRFPRPFKHLLRFADVVNLRIFGLFRGTIFTELTVEAN